MDSIKVNGIDLAYIRRGQGKPLVLIHGFPLDGQLWKEILPSLEDKFDLIVPDLRGFGKSSMGAGTVLMDDYAKDIAGLLDALKVEKAAIVGHSMGGYVALAFARLFPQRMLGLGLISSQVLADPPDRKEGRYKSAADVEQNGVSGLADAMAAKFTTDKKIQDFSRELISRQSPAACVQALKAMAERNDSTPLLEEVTYPVLVIHGDADALIPIDRAREVKAAHPSAHLAVLPGVGHVPMLEDVSGTAQALKALA